LSEQSNSKLSQLKQATSTKQEAIEVEDDDGFVVLENKPPQFAAWRDEPIDLVVALDLNIGMLTLRDGCARQPYLLQPLVVDGDLAGMSLRGNVTRMFT
jgi:hypothetical protein